MNLGNLPDDGEGDTLRDAFDKINRNFDELLEVLALRALDTSPAPPPWPGEFVPRHLADAPPSEAPPLLGAIWVDTSSGSVFVSIGTRSKADWRRVSLSEADA